MRMKGEDRQVPIKGAWHWNAFEQEPEKTWTSMEVHFNDLVDVTPPAACRVPPFEVPTFGETASTARGSHAMSGHNKDGENVIPSFHVTHFHLID